MHRMSNLLKELSVRLNTLTFDHFDALAKGCPATVLAFFPQHSSLTVEILILAYSQSRQVEDFSIHSFLPNVSSFLKVSPSSHILL